LPKKSYWRIRTVLGKVLGCLPGVQSICGWIGPCPPVEFIPGDLSPRYVRLKARQITPLQYQGQQTGDVIFISNSSGVTDELRLRDDEELEPWMAEIKDPNSWVIPEPPVKQISTCEIKSIQLREDLSGREQDEDSKLMYRDQIVFKMDASEAPITFKLFTTPIFVTPPSCYSGQKGPHEVHLRELKRYDDKNIWTIEQLKEHTAEDTEDIDVMIINATGKGAELLARAWCSERGKNAVIRRAGGPCFVCAERAASRNSFNFGVLIWVSSG
jgi:hypothetical protein